jgi:hypothetical protein
MRRSLVKNIYKTEQTMQLVIHSFIVLMYNTIMTQKQKHANVAVSHFQLILGNKL